MATGTRLAGRLSFTVRRDGKVTGWSIQPARDSYPQRLALVDQANDAQGYLNVIDEGNRLSLEVLPRPPQVYTGELSFVPECALGARAFACRTRLPDQSLVVQMASGPADSLLNDSLFDPERDLVLRFGGKDVSIFTHPTAPDQPPAFRAHLTAIVPPLRDGDSTITLEIVPSYYRARYIPEFRLIDRKRCPTPPTGWMSWNAYFDAATEKDNLDEARIAARMLKPFGLQIWSIESWQENSARQPVSDFHNLGLRASPDKFPHGMKWLAEQIRTLGFRPGIWTVPWGTGDENYYRAHREWFLHDSQGQPMHNWNGRYVLDPSQPEVRWYMEETLRTMSKEWGYEFFKIDGISDTGPSYSAHFFERPEVRAAFRQPVADPYRISIEALRRGIGPDSIFLACAGHYTGPEVAWADAARLGADIVEPGQPPRWHNYLNQAYITLAQLFTNNLVWYNDPDTLMVGEAAPLSVARIATTVVALPGQLTFISDKLGQLASERMRLLQQALPVCDVHPLDLMPIPDLKPVWDLKIHRPFASWDIVSVFNWGDEQQEYRLPFAALGLDDDKDYLLYEFWSRKFLGVKRGFVDARVDPRSNLLLAVHELQNHPQFLSTDRHISQGGVELADVLWNQDRGELTSRLKLVENDPLTMFVHVPATYGFSKAAAVGATVEHIVNAAPIISVVLRRSTSGEASLVLVFVRRFASRMP
ncbi:MAG: alpha-galactosidase [Terriglobia bacterium]